MPLKFNVVVKIRTFTAYSKYQWIVVRIPQTLRASTPPAVVAADHRRLLASRTRAKPYGKTSDQGIATVPTLFFVRFAGSHVPRASGGDDSSICMLKK